MQKISNFFLINFLKQDVLYINQKNKILQINPIYFLMNLKQTFRLKKFNLPIGIYVADKQCRVILQNLLNTTGITFLSDNNFIVLKSKVSIIFLVQTSIFSDKSLVNSLKDKKNFIIKIHHQTNQQKISETFYSILLDSFSIKNLFFLVTFFRFFVKL